MGSFLLFAGPFGPGLRSGLINKRYLESFLPWLPKAEFISFGRLLLYGLVQEKHSGRSKEIQSVSISESCAR